MNPRGNIMRREVMVPFDCGMGQGSRIAVTVKANRDNRRHFTRHCEAQGIHVLETFDRSEGSGEIDYVVGGTIESLDTLCGPNGMGAHPSVKRWQYLIDVKPPRTPDVENDNWRDMKLPCAHSPMPKDAGPRVRREFRLRRQGQVAQWQADKDELRTKSEREAQSLEYAARSHGEAPPVVTRPQRFRTAYLLELSRQLRADTPAETPAVRPVTPEEMAEFAPEDTATQAALLTPSLKMNPDATW